jgi:hypothetical protein
LIPKGDKVWVTYCRLNSEDKYFVTTKNGNKDIYYLYKGENGQVKKIDKSGNPNEFESIIKFR